jgi:Domain of unknown function (DUF4386)
MTSATARTETISINEWSSLYKIAGIAAILIVIIIPVQGVVFSIWRPPTTVPEWFALFQRNPIVGLLDLDLLLIVDYILTIPIYLALWVALRRANPSLAAIAVIMQIVSVTTYFASMVAFEMLTLSNLYTTAATDNERTIFLAAGQAMMTTWQGTAFNVSYFLGCIAMIAFSVVMLKSTIFSKTTAIFGLVAGILMIVPPTVGLVGLVLSFL